VGGDGGGAFRGLEPLRVGRRLLGRRLKVCQAPTRRGEALLKAAECASLLQLVRGRGGGRLEPPLLGERPRVQST
jgi:hypothetical protein